jgi:hypothetical protein
VLTLDAWHLPAAAGGDIERTTTPFVAAGLEVRTPVLRPGAIARIGRTLRDRAGPALRRRPVAEILDVIDRAAARLADPADPIGEAARLALPVTTGLASAMVATVLERIALDWRRPALEALIDQELGGPAALDGFTAAGDDRRVHARGPNLVFHNLAGNVPGVAVTSLVRALLVKAPSLARTATAEPVLAPLFARAIAEDDPAIGAALAVTNWSVERADALDEAIAAADTIIAYGGAEATSALRERTPADRRFIEHGPRLSFGIVGRRALADPESAARTAEAVARATALFDQQGCVSPHIVFVETGAALPPIDLAGRIATALDALRETLPRGRLDAAEAAAIHGARASAEFRAIAGAGTRVWASADTSWTVIFDAMPALEASPLLRTLLVRPVPAAADVPDLVRPHGPLLQTAALAGLPDSTDLLHALADAGVTRITTFERMPWPPPTWHHDGLGPLRSLIRWIDRET